MGFKKLYIESYFPDEEMTRFGFISHMESYIKQLLTNPVTAKVDDYLMKFGLGSPSALLLLLKRSDPSDENSAILIRKEKIVPEELSEEDIANGKKPKDKFVVKYKLPRKDYMKKMRNLYISLFENHCIDGKSLNEENANDLESKVKKKKGMNDKITYSFGKNGWGLSDELLKIGKDIKKLSKNNNVYIEKAIIDALDDVYDITIGLRPIEEGAWGNGILDNDAALDYQTTMVKELMSKFVSDIVSFKDDSMNLWAHLGVLIDFLKKFKNDEIQFTDEYTATVMFARRMLEILFKDKNFIEAWEEPNEMKSTLKKLDKELATFVYEKDMLNPVNKDPNLDGERLNEDGECAGATSAGVSGQYSQPLFGKKIEEDTAKPIKRTIYMTEEQLNYLKEEAVMDSPINNFGYDAPAFGNKNDPAFNHKDMFKKGFQGK